MPHKIDRIELFHVDVPLPTPFYPVWIRGYPQRRLRHTLLRITTRDGHTGVATGPAFEREGEGLGELIGPFLLGLDPFDYKGAADRLQQASFLGWHNHWMEIAFWDLAAQAQGVPLWRLLANELGLPLAREAPSAPAAYASFAEARSIAARAETMERARRAGFRAAKLGLASTSEEADHQVVRSAREAVGADFELMVHTHQGWRVSVMEAAPVWDLARASRFIAAAADLDYRWVQEPLSPRLWPDLVQLARGAKVPIGGGCIATSAIELEALLDWGAYQFLTPDAAFAGPSAMLHLMRRSRTLGRAFSPHSYGDGTSLLANLHLLLAWSMLDGISGPIRLELPWEPPAIIPEHRDALYSEPLEVRSDGTVLVPTAPGLGRDLDPVALRRYGRRFYTITPVRFVVSSARRSGLSQATAFAQPERVARRRRSSVPRGDVPAPKI